MFYCFPACRNVDARRCRIRRLKLVEAGVIKYGVYERELATSRRV